MKRVLLGIALLAGSTANAQIALLSEVRLSPERVAAIGIETQTAEMKSISRWLQAPGRVEINSYRTSSVTTRIPAQIIKRHVRLGDVIDRNDPIVTLSSVQMAEAQGELQGSYREWTRVQRLGKDLVGEARYVAAQIAYRQANARVRAYGMTEGEVRKFLGDPNAIAIGEFRLLSPRHGVVLNDHFLDGAIVDPGEVLTMIADESVARIEAYLFPEEAESVALDAQAKVRIAGDWFDGVVKQKHHLLDPETRTMAVRVEIERFSHSTHPGQFVEVEILAGYADPALVIPESALIRDASGRYLVFKKTSSGVFEAVVVTPSERGREGVRVEGLREHDDVVISGGLYLLAELNRRAPRQVSH